MSRSALISCAVLTAAFGAVAVVFICLYALTGSGRHSLLKNTGKVAVVYAYHDNGSPSTTENLVYFLRVGVGRHVPNVHGYVVINGVVTPAVRAALKARNAYVTVLERENVGYDFGAFGHGARSLVCDKIPYSHVIFLNTSVRGPFVPAYCFSQRWVDLFLSPLSRRVRLVGPTVNPTLYGDSATPHVQSCAFGMDLKCLLYLLDHTSVFDCTSNDKDYVVRNHEMGLSKAVFDAGWDIACFIIGYQEIHFQKASAKELEPNPPIPASYHGEMYASGTENLAFGRNLSPLELMFIKTNRNFDMGLIQSLTNTSAKHLHRI